MQIDLALWLKGVAVAVGAMALSFFMPIWPFLLFTVALCLADLYTGTQAAKHRGEVIHSKGFRRSIKKISLYFTALLLTEGFNQVFLAKKGISLDLTWVTAGLIALTEIRSNFENIGCVTGVDLWTKWAERIPPFFKLPDKKE
jgi:phage-related holin